MITRALVSSALTLMPVLPVAGAAQARDARNPATDPVVLGVVVDRDTRRAIAGVAVTMQPTGYGADNPAAPPPDLTDADGRFGFTQLDDGVYRIVLVRIGYRTVVDSVSFRADMGLRIQVEMASSALELDPVLVVTEARSRNLRANGFYHRRERGIGRFVSRDEAVLRDALLTSDVFRYMPGVRMSSVGRLGNRGVVLLRGGCVADVYLDGVRTIRPFQLDALVRPGDLDAIEVYQGSEVPARFASTGCGAVVLWTHTPNPTPGQSLSWKKILVVAGLVGGSMLLTR